MISIQVILCTYQRCFTPVAFVFLICKVEVILNFICVRVSHSVVSDSLQPHGLYVIPQAPLSVEFSRQEYWLEVPFPSPGDPPNLVSPNEGRFFIV